MLEGFVEHIAGPTIIIRVGPDARAHGKRYRRSVFGEVIDARRVILKGYDDDVDPEFFSSIMRQLHLAGFQEVSFDRMGPPRRTLTVVVGPGGAVSMSVHYHREPKLAAE